MRTNKLLKGWVLVIGFVVLMAGYAYSWPQPPDVVIFDWIKYAGVNGQIDFYAEDLSNTYIIDWWWEYSSEPAEVEENSNGGYNAWASASISFDQAGVYYATVNALNQYMLEDSDWG